MNEARLAERVARESYGRLLALLVARTRDVTAAEDALAEAFAAALTAWPRTGAPENPEAWLYAAARRKLIDAARRAQTAAAHAPELERRFAAFEADMAQPEIPDRRLGLMFACAHPEIDENARTPLMLQAVLGFSAERIASAFFVEPAAMSQRLVRAKRKIRDADVPFDIPEPAQWPARIAAVLHAVYAAFSAGWSDPLGLDPERGGLAEEAIWLGRVLAAHLPDEPEVLGLLALMLHLDARRTARRDDEGRFVPLDEQDVALWRRDLLTEAERLLHVASTHDKPGRFQLEAAIQSAHIARLWGGQTDWRAIAMLYQALAELTGSPVAHLNLAAALARCDGAGAGLAEAEAARNRFPALGEYQPYWALVADLNAKLDRNDSARAAYDEAIARENDGAVIAFLSARRDALTRSGD